MELLPCACVLVPLIGLLAWVAFAPLLQRNPKPNGATPPSPPPPSPRNKK